MVEQTSSFLRTGTAILEEWRKKSNIEVVLLYRTLQFVWVF